MSVRSARYNLLSLRNPKGLTVIPEERDAWAFLDAAGITSSREQRAVIELVRGLKNAQLWTKMKAIYPFVGGTATTHKYNLKDPQDIDAAFRLTFSGGYTHSSNGITGNGTNAYANTYMALNVLQQNSAHATLYSRTNSSIAAVDIGSTDNFNSPFSTLTLFARWTDDKIYAAINQGNDVSGMSVSNTNSSGYFVLNRTGASAQSIKRNDSTLTTGTQSSVSLNNLTIYISANHTNNPDQARNFSSRNYAFATIGDGLTDTDATALYNIVQRFQLALGRQIEPDASAFITAAGITDATQQAAITDLVISLKNEGLWTKMKAIYPFVGGTATTHKFNLKDPRDADAAFRLNFSGGWTHSSNGADPNGANSYADTYCTPSIDLGLNSTHIMYYSRENSNATEVEFGSRNTANTNYLIIEIRTSGVTYGRAYDNAYMTFNDADSIGCYVLNRTSSTALSILKNNVSKATTTRTASARPDTSLFLGAFNEGGAPGFYSTKQCGFATIGDGLTDTEATAFYNIVQRFQTSLGRQV